MRLILRFHLHILPIIYRSSGIQFSKYIVYFVKFKNLNELKHVCWQLLSLFLAPAGAQEIQIFVRLSVCLMKVCLEHTIFIFCSLPTSIGIM